MFPVKGPNLWVQSSLEDKKKVHKWSMSVIYKKKNKRSSWFSAHSGKVLNFTGTVCIISANILC